MNAVPSAATCAAARLAVQIDMLDAHIEQGATCDALEYTRQEKLAALVELKRLHLERSAAQRAAQTAQERVAARANERAHLVAFSELLNRVLCSDVAAGAR
jgi:hypothetical protein